MGMHNPPHPGEIIREFCIQPLDLTVTEAAKAVGVTRKTLSALLNGRSGISPEMALRLSKVFGRSPEGWLKLQLQYDLWTISDELKLHKHLKRRSITMGGEAMKILRHIGSLAFVLGLFSAVFVGIPWHVIVADDPVVPLWLKAAVFCLLGGILLVLLTVAFEQKRNRISEEDIPAPAADTSVLLLNSATLPGRDISKSLGLVQGHTVFAIWLGKDLSAIVRLIVGGELTEYTEMMGEAREVATNRMIAQAAKMGADAIINVRYMTTSVVGTAAELLVYGTAVKLGQ
jgi:addiction module HigA family antidote